MILRLARGSAPTRSSFRHYSDELLVARSTYFHPAPDPPPPAAPAPAPPPPPCAPELAPAPPCATNATNAAESAVDAGSARNHGGARCGCVLRNFARRGESQGHGEAAIARASRRAPVLSHPQQAQVLTIVAPASRPPHPLVRQHRNRRADDQRRQAHGQQCRWNEQRPRSESPDERNNRNGAGRGDEQTTTAATR